MPDDDTEPGGTFAPLVPKSKYPAVIQRVGEILQEARDQKLLPNEETTAFRDEISSFTKKSVKKIISDRDAIHSEQASDRTPDTIWKEFSLSLQTGEGPVTLNAEINPQNKATLHINYVSSYISKDNFLIHVDGTFVSNDDGEFAIIQEVKNYDTGKVTLDLHEFSLSDLQIKKEAVEAASYVQEMLYIYLEEN